MANTTGRHPPAGRGSEGEGGPGFEGESWEQRHIRVTFWLERTLRDEVREAAKGAGVEHHPVHCAGSSTRRRRLRVAPLPESIILGGLCLWNAPPERHPASSSRAGDRVAVAMWATPSVAHNVPLSWEGDVRGDVTLRSGFSTRTVRDRDGRRGVVVLANGVPGRRNLHGSLPLGSEGDVQGDTRRASSPSESTFLWPTSAQSGTDRPSLPTGGEEGWCQR